jgi:hypothetical protein
VYPALVLADVVVSPDGGLTQVTIPANTVMLLVSGGNLESQIGLPNIQNVSGDSVTMGGLAIGVSN